MARDLIRLYVEPSLSPGASVDLGEEQAGYVLRVMRLATGDAVLLFNGRDGEHRARIAEAGRRSCRLEVTEQVRPQLAGPDIDYLFAPLKRARLDYMVQKATELGVRCLRPVVTEHTQVERINLERMRANAIEAAEQCGILWVPGVLEPVPLDGLLRSWETGRRIVLADEAAAQSAAIERLAGIGPGPLAVLVGPEGGFSAAERQRLLSRPFVTPISLGPRIMRADTAAVAALALVNAVLGDWR
jgi:16S rRNA (uracil1498-N3)-methyltransferase